MLKRKICGWNTARTNNTLVVFESFQTLFKRPKDVIALKFTEMISTLVSFRYLTKNANKLASLVSKYK